VLISAVGITVEQEAAKCAATASRIREIHHWRWELDAGIKPPISRNPDKRKTTEGISTNEHNSIVPVDDWQRCKRMMVNRSSMPRVLILKVLRQEPIEGGQLLGWFAQESGHKSQSILSQFGDEIKAGRAPMLKGVLLEGTDNNNYALANKQTPNNAWKRTNSKRGTACTSFF
jgi:hypothetical protein